jgi:hypothetical protein
MSAALRDSSVEDGSEEHFDLQRSHAYTFPFLNPDIYGDGGISASSQASLLSPSSTPFITKPGNDPREFELEVLLPKEEKSKQSQFHEGLLPPTRDGPGYHSPPAQKYVSWGVSLEQPILMVVFLFLGMTTAITTTSTTLDSRVARPAM